MKIPKQTIATAFACFLALGTLTRTSGAQLPDHPRNLRVLPKDMSTDSVFVLMLRVADALGVTCGHCHVGGDNRTWDSTNFASDVKPAKVTARAMFQLVEQLNHQLLPPITHRGSDAVVVTCMTCHRGTLRPMELADTLSTVVASQGADTAIAVYDRIRERLVDRAARGNGGPNSMTYDMRDVALNELADRLMGQGHAADAVRLLEENERVFPNSASAAMRLGTAYESIGQPQKAITQYHKVLSVEPRNQRAQARLKALDSLVAPNTVPRP